MIINQSFSKSYISKYGKTLINIIFAHFNQNLKSIGKLLVWQFPVFTSKVDGLSGQLSHTLEVKMTIIIRFSQEIDQYFFLYLCF